MVATKKGDTESASSVLYKTKLLRKDDSKRQQSKVLDLPDLLKESLLQLQRHVAPWEIMRAESWVCLPKIFWQQEKRILLSNVQDKNRKNKGLQSYDMRLLPLWVLLGVPQRSNCRLRSLEAILTYRLRRQDARRIKESTRPWEAQQAEMQHFLLHFCLPSHSGDCLCTLVFGFTIFGSDWKQNAKSSSLHSGGLRISAWDSAWSHSDPVCYHLLYLQTDTWLLLRTVLQKVI